MPLLATTAPDPDSGGVSQRLKQALIRGLVLVVPLLLTVLILGFVVNFVFKRLQPFSNIIESILGVPNIPEFAIQAAVLVALVVLILFVGLISENWSGSDKLESTFDNLISSIPGIGSVYSSFNEMSELLLDSQSQSFREVKLVEFPKEGSYCLAFVTAQSPEALERNTEKDDLVTLFMPMAPNPVMGGYVLTVESDKVIDIDISVEEGIRAIVTSGVSLGRKSDIQINSEEISQFETAPDPSKMDISDESPSDGNR